VTLTCTQGWEALAADPLAWLLDDHRPSLLWRVLVELVGRPADAPAVVRPRSGASADEPVATLLAELLPDGSWMTRARTWTPFSGPGWRILAAIRLGADPSDPRLQAAAELLLRSLGEDGGVVRQSGGGPQPCLTAQLVEAMTRLGLARDRRVETLTAWLEERPLAAAGGWWCGHPRHMGAGGCRITAVAVLGAAADGADRVRERLLARAAGALVAGLPVRAALGEANLDRTDAAESLHALARCGASYDPRMRSALLRIQAAQDARARWRADAVPPRSLPTGEARSSRLSGWVTLRAVAALLRWGAEAGLPRRFPQKPRG
jgi:hypothetical protein